MEAQDIIVSVVPFASKTEVVAENCSYIKVRLKAVPHKGKANAELIKFLSKKFDVPKSQVEIVQGLTNKEKLVRIYK